MADFKTTLEKIKTRGYWQVNIRPVQIQENLIESVTRAKEIMQASSVQFRGWDYPHFPTQTRDHQDLYVGENDSIEGWIDWENFKEAWRFYTNGQFIHLFGLREDWYEEHSWINENDPLRKIKPGTVLEVIGTVYSITEMYAFFGNLVQNLPVSEVEVEISLFGTKDRKLHISDFRRSPLFMDYSCRLDKVNLQKKVYKKEDLITNYVDLAFDQIVYLMHRFNWDNPNVAVIKEDQKKLIERRI
jgi:hypothetical protein